MKTEVSTLAYTKRFMNNHHPVRALSIDRKAKWYKNSI